jgi:hypothetical protein
VQKLYDQLVEELEECRDAEKAKEILKKLKELQAGSTVAAKELNMAIESLLESLE